MKRFFLVLLFIFSLLTLSSVSANARDFGDDGGGSISPDFGNGGDISCSNGSTGHYDASPLPNIGEPGGENPGPPDQPVCIPDGQGCPQTQTVRVMTSPGKYCSPASQVHKLCTPKAAQYSSQEVQLNCCTTCNNGICGGQPPTEPPVVPPTTVPPSVPPTVTVTITSTPTHTPTPTVTSTPTPTTPPPACNTSCSNDFACQAAKDGCTACIDNKCQPPATPTPVFKPECVCDTIVTSPVDIFSGQKITVTAFAKVPKNVASTQQVLDQSFALYKGAETLVQRLAFEKAVPATQDSEDANFVRYKSTWSFTMPQMGAGETYRIGAQLNCQPKTQAMNFSPDRSVLGTATGDTGLIASLIHRIKSLLGIGSTSRPSNIATAPTPTPIIVGSSITQDDEGAAAKRSLQLKVILPATIYEKTCDYIKFRSNGF